MHLKEALQRKTAEGGIPLSERYKGRFAGRKGVAKKVLGDAYQPPAPKLSDRHTASGRAAIAQQLMKTKPVDAESMTLEQAKKKYPNVNFKGRISPGARRAMIAQQEHARNK